MVIMAPLKNTGMDYSHLSDPELAQRLVDYGVDIGPINVATRSTYERKLYSLENGQASPPNQHFEAVPDDDDGGDDEVQLRMPKQKPSPRPKISPPKEPAQPRLRREPNDTYAYSTPRIESRAGLNVSRKMTSLYSDSKPAISQPVQRRVSPPPPSSESKSIPLWVKLICLLVVAVLVYLIYTNMEPQAVSNIPPGVTQKVEV